MTTPRKYYDIMEDSSGGGEKELTPMAELISWIDTQYEKGVVPTAYNIHNKATSLLEAERKMYELAFDTGGDNALQIGIPDFIDGSDYFTSKYRQQ